ncbi:MAG: hypothetical protein Q4C70_06505 [Planctomycetia bacterium]|nr:hypothetical protein [Planctomycetia bacterium]
MRFRKRFLKLCAFLSVITLFSLFSASASAQVMLEFTWTLEGVNYEGLLYVPTDKPATMTVRVLDVEGNRAALILERVDLRTEKNGRMILQCEKPEILTGTLEKPHLPEAFRAQDEEAGKVSNGRAEALYEINIIDSGNIKDIVPKYLIEKEE